jgi:hypothetical protein
MNNRKFFATLTAGDSGHCFVIIRYSRTDLDCFICLHFSRFNAYGR